jgi:hypothetical protein
MGKAGFLFEPKGFLEFVHTTIFDRVWKQLGLNDEGDLASLQASIMVDPKAWPVITGTGGARKLRFAPPDWPVGKSGALRVIYSYFEPFHVCALVLVYPKATTENISNDDKKAIKGVIAAIEAGLGK